MRSDDLVLLYLEKKRGPQNRKGSNRLEPLPVLDWEKKKKEEGLHLNHCQQRLEAEPLATTPLGQHSNSLY